MSKEHYLRKELYSLLRKDEKIFDFVVESSLNGFLISDLENGEEWVSSSFWNMLGYNDDVINTEQYRLKDLLHPEDVVTVSEAMKQHCEDTNIPYDVIVRYKSKNNTWIWTRFRGLAISVKAGKPVRMFGTFQDVSQQKSAEIQKVKTIEKAQENEERYKGLINSLEAGVVVHAADSSIVSCNNRASELLGLSKDQMMGKVAIDPHWKFIYEDKTTINIEEYPVMQVLKKMETLENMVLGVVVPNKRVSWLMVNGFPYFNRKKQLSEVVISFIDITKLKLTEEKLIEAKEKAEANEDKIKIQNRSISLNNDRLESLLKISQYQTQSIQDLLDYVLDEAIKLTESKIGYIYYYSEEKRQFILNTWSKEVMKECAVQNPNTVYDLDKTGCWGDAVRLRKPIVLNNYEKQLPSKKGVPDGHVKLKKFLTIPVMVDEQIVAVVGVANKENDYNDSDIRQLTLLMDNVWKISERIKLVKDLAQAKDKAEEANRLKTEFLNNLSHEIRTPMNGIIGFGQMLEKGNLTDEKRKSYINIIQSSSYQLLHVIDDLLEISILETKQEKCNESEFLLNDLLMELFSVFNLEMKKQQLSLYLKKALSDEQSLIISDRIKLFKIISNLLTNAIKYTNEGEIEFGYYIDKSNLVLYVKDTGIGIDSKNHRLIFDRFSQEYIGNSRIHEGLGLGLSISKENAQLLGGDITLESEKGVGSTFYVTIPYKTNLLSVQEQEENAAQMVENERVYKVLVAEDEVVNYLYIEELLNSEFNKEHTIIHAKNGIEAVDICSNDKDIDLVLMDIKMPLMNGYIASQKIKAKYPSLPIIAQTAYSTRQDENLAYQYGCDAFISKPINKETLIALCEKFLLKKK
jgi:PAS domain S-box-containing protein